MDSLVPFLGTALLVTAAPGPDNLGIIGLGLSRGRNAALGFALGCTLGCLTHTLWATLGVAALVMASPVAFTVLKFAGAAYLIYLGVQALRSRGSGLAETKPGPSTQFLARGFIANAINPKVALFFLAFLPQFVDATSPVPRQMATLGLLFALVTVVVFGPLALFSGVVGDWLRRTPGASIWLDRLTGILFVGLAVRLAFAQR